MHNDKNGNTLTSPLQRACLESRSLAIAVSCVAQALFGGPHEKNV
jgi:hypothetical protein